MTGGSTVSLSGGATVLHLVFFSPFSSAQLAVVIQVGEGKKWMGVVSSGGVGTGKHEDIFDQRNKKHSL